LQNQTATDGYHNQPVTAGLANYPHLMVIVKDNLPTLMLISIFIAKRVLSYPKSVGHCKGHCECPFFLGVYQPTY